MKRCRREQPDWAALRAKDNLAPPMSSVRSFTIKKCSRTGSGPARISKFFLAMARKAL
jgi:hypothetical protein